MAEARKGEILSAALEEFAAKGYDGATIKSIAGAAGLQSPALIYHYFPDKESLFREVLEAHAPPLQIVPDLERDSELPPEAVLTKLGRSYLALGGSSARIMRLVLGEVTRRSEVSEALSRSGPGRVLAFLEGYLRRQVELGRLRPHDTRSGARSFVGMLIPQVAAKVIFPALDEDSPDDEEHLRFAVGLFLRGLAPENGEESERDTGTETG